MEVHSHTHSVPIATGRKKWTHYLWEFLMLFLAVFCGFLAENQREHMVEHRREKEFMVTMLEDLKSDKSLLDSTMRYWEAVNKSIDSVTDAITIPTTQSDWSKAYRHINEALNYWGFKFNDRTVTQLKNSGNFRLIRNKMVANKIIAYDQFNSTVTGIQLQHNKFYENATELRSKIFVEKIISFIQDKYGNDPAPGSMNYLIDSLIDKNKVPVASEDQTALIFEFENKLIALKRDYTSNVNWGYVNARRMINELIKIIQENYHLE
jgi:hypothetical protein